MMSDRFEWARWCGRCLTRAVAPILFVASIVIAVSPTGASATADGPDGFRVVGVVRGDVLWIREGPSPRYRRVGSIPFNGRGILNYGCRQFGSSWWCEVSYRGVVGWSNGRYLAED